MSSCSECEDGYEENNGECDPESEPDPEPEPEPGPEPKNPVDTFVNSPGFIALITVVSVAGLTMVVVGAYFGIKAIMNKNTAPLAPAELTHDPIQIKSVQDDKKWIDVEEINA